MNLLAINTAFKQTYVCACNQDKNEYLQIDSSLKQSENILGAIDDCLNKVKMNVRDLNAIACVIGPGSFTGIRIGASLVKGFLAPLKNIKKIEINSLDLLAFTYSKTSNSEFWVILNALSGNLFACKYNCNGERLIEPMLCFGEELKNISGIVVGLLEENLEICNQYLEFTSEELLDYTSYLYKNNIFSDDYRPLYLRKSQAEEQMDKKNENKKIDNK